jgi:hypothetical protein
VKQLKELLSLNRVDYRGCCEKPELIERVTRLWQENSQTRKGEYCIYDAFIINAVVSLSFNVLNNTLLPASILYIFLSEHSTLYRIFSGLWVTLAI